jgi:hypothetical protein
MKIKAYWKNKNPFAEIDRLAYSKTVELPDGTDLENIRQFAIEDTKDGFVFDKLEVLTD